MSAPDMLPLIPADPESEPAERRRVIAGLQALQARLPRLLFAAPRDDQGVATLTRLARRINSFLEVTGTILRESVPEGSPVIPGARPTAEVHARLVGIAEDADRLVGALDAFLGDPDAEACRVALEEAINQIAGNVSEGPRAWTSQLAAPWAEPASTHSSTGESPPASPPWRAAAERDGWRDLQLHHLRRQTHLALGLAGLALVGLALSLFNGQGFPTGPEIWPNPGSPSHDPSQMAPATGSGAPDVGFARPATGLTANEAETLAQVPQRQAELELAVLYLRARLEALEKQQEDRDRARARAQNAAEEPSSRPTD